MKKLFLLAVFACLGGCVATNTYDQLGVSALTVKTAADIIHAECGNESPGGPCLESSVISTEEKNRFRRQLQMAHNGFRQALVLIELERPADAESQIFKAQSILKAIEQILVERGVQ